MLSLLFIFYAFSLLIDGPYLTNRTAIKKRSFLPPNSHLSYPYSTRFSPSVSLSLSLSLSSSSL